MLVFFSTKSGNTKRFTERFSFENQQIPLNVQDQITVNQSYVLVIPTYGGGTDKGSVPKQVIHFLKTGQRLEPPSLTFQLDIALNHFDSMELKKNYLVDLIL